MNWWQILLVALVAGFVVACLTLMHILDINNLYTSPIEAGLVAAIGAAGLILYFRSSESRARRRAISMLFSLSGLIFGKLLISQGIDFLGRIGVNVPFKDDQAAKANGLLKAVMQSDWRVDSLLVIVAFGLCYLATQLLREGGQNGQIEGGGPGVTEPIMTWDTLRRHLVSSGPNSKNSMKFMETFWHRYGKSAKTSNYLKTSNM
jgi:hypothetical protein